MAFVRDIRGKHGGLSAKRMMLVAEAKGEIILNHAPSFVRWWESYRQTRLGVVAVAVKTVEGWKQLKD